MRSTNAVSRSSLGSMRMMTPPLLAPSNETILLMWLVASFGLTLFDELPQTADHVVGAAGPRAGPVRGR